MDLKAMRIVCISDTHGDHDKAVIPECDVLIHAGDWSRDDSTSCVIDFLKWMDKQPATHKLLIAGNHDWIAEKNSGFFKGLISSFGDSITYLQDNGVKIDGISFWGSPVQPRFFNWAFNRDRGSDILRHWALIPEETNVLITHGPPFGTLDKSMNRGFNDHLGCEDLATCISTRKIDIHVFGHIHGSYGVERKNGVTYVNASQMNEDYLSKNRPHLINYEPSNAAAQEVPKAS